MDVQALGPEATVEGLDEGIVGRLARPGEVERDTALVGPKIQRIDASLSAIDWGAMLEEVRLLVQDS